MEMQGVKYSQTAVCCDAIGKRRVDCWPSSPFSPSLEIGLLINPPAFTQCSRETWRVCGKVCKISMGLNDLILDTLKSMTGWALGGLCLALLEWSSDLGQAVLASQGIKGKIGRKLKWEASEPGVSGRAQRNLVSWADESCCRSQCLWWWSPSSSVPTGVSLSLSPFLMGTHRPRALHLFGGCVCKSSTTHHWFSLELCGFRSGRQPTHRTFTKSPSLLWAVQVSLGFWCVWFVVIFSTLLHLQFPSLYFFFLAHWSEWLLWESQGGLVNEM